MFSEINPSARTTLSTAGVGLNISSAGPRTRHSSAAGSRGAGSKYWPRGRSRRGRHEGGNRPPHHGYGYGGVSDDWHLGTGASDNDDADDGDRDAQCRFAVVGGRLSGPSFGGGSNAHDMDGDGGGGSRTCGSFGRLSSPLSSRLCVMPIYGSTQSPQLFSTAPHERVSTRSPIVSSNGQQPLTPPLPLLCVGGHTPSDGTKSPTAADAAVPPSAIGGGTMSTRISYYARPEWGALACPSPISLGHAVDTADDGAGPKPLSLSFAREGASGARRHGHACSMGSSGIGMGDSICARSASAGSSRYDAGQRCPAGVGPPYYGEVSPPCPPPAGGVGGSSCSGLPPPVVVLGDGASRSCSPHAVCADAFVRNSFAAACSNDDAVRSGDTALGSAPLLLSAFSPAEVPPPSHHWRAHYSSGAASGGRPSASLSFGASGTGQAVGACNGPDACMYLGMPRILLSQRPSNAVVGGGGGDCGDAATPPREAPRILVESAASAVVDGGRSRSIPSVGAGRGAPTRPSLLLSVGSTSPLPSSGYLLISPRRHSQCEGGEYEGGAYECEGGAAELPSPHRATRCSSPIHLPEGHLPEGHLPEGHLPEGRSPQLTARPAPAAQPAEGGEQEPTAGDYEAEGRSLCCQWTVDPSAHCATTAGDEAASHSHSGEGPPLLLGNSPLLLVSTLVGPSLPPMAALTTPLPDGDPIGDQLGADGDGERRRLSHLPSPIALVVGGSAGGGCRRRSTSEARLPASLSEWTPLSSPRHCLEGGCAPPQAAVPSALEPLGDDGSLVVRRGWVAGEVGTSPSSLEEGCSVHTPRPLAVTHAAGTAPPPLQGFPSSPQSDEASPHRHALVADGDNAQHLPHSVQFHPPIASTVPFPLGQLGSYSSLPSSGGPSVRVVGVGAEGAALFYHSVSNLHTTHPSLGEGPTDRSSPNVAALCVRGSGSESDAEGRGDTRHGGDGVSNSFGVVARRGTVGSRGVAFLKGLRDDLSSYSPLGQRRCLSCESPIYPLAVSPVQQSIATSSFFHNPLSFSALNSCNVPPVTAGRGGVSGCRGDHRCCPPLSVASSRASSVHCDGVRSPKRSRSPRASVSVAFSAASIAYDDGGDAYPDGDLGGEGLLALMGLAGGDGVHEEGVTVSGGGCMGAWAAGAPSSAAPRAGAEGGRAPRDVPLALPLLYSSGLHGGLDTAPWLVGTAAEEGEGRGNALQAVVLPSTAGIGTAAAPTRAADGALPMRRRCVPFVVLQNTCASCNRGALGDEEGDGRTARCGSVMEGCVASALAAARSPAPSSSSASRASLRGPLVPC